MRGICALSTDARDLGTPFSATGFQMPFLYVKKEDCDFLDALLQRYSRMSACRHSETHAAFLELTIRWSAARWGEVRMGWHAYKIVVTFVAPTPEPSLPGLSKTVLRNFCLVQVWFNFPCQEEEKEPEAPAYLLGWEVSSTVPWTEPCCVAWTFWDARAHSVSGV